MPATEPVLLAASSKGAAHLCDSRSGGLILTLKDCHPTPAGLAASQQLVLSVESTRSAIHMWSWHKEQPEYRCQAPERLTAICCTADGAHCVGGAASGQLYLWQIATGRLLLSWEAHFKAVSSLTCCIHDGWLLSGGEDAIVFCWSFAHLLGATDGRVQRPQPTRTWTAHTLAVTALTASQCGQHALLASASADQTVRLWRLSEATPGCIFTAELGAPLTCVALHPAHDAAYAGGTDGRIFAAWLMAPQTASADATPTGSAFSAGRASAGAAGIARVPPTPRQQQNGAYATGAATHLGSVRSIVASFDGSRIFSCAAEAGVWVWDSRTLVLLTRLLSQQPISQLLLLRCPATASGDAAAAAAAQRRLVAPLKKYAAVADQEASAAASDEALGSVPVFLRRGNTASEALPPETMAWARPLPLLRSALGMERAPCADSFLPWGQSPLEAGSVLTAEDSHATVELRAQLAEWQQINSELFALACHRQFAGDMGADTEA